MGFKMPGHVKPKRWLESLTKNPLICFGLFIGLKKKQHEKKQN